jgi:putative Holliday junction resolvase
MYDKKLIQGKRIAAIDYGTKRIGIAVCDELHISINPLSTIEATKPDYFDRIMSILTNERISLVIVGYPHQALQLESEIQKAITDFVIHLKEKNMFKVITYDESYSTEEAYNYMSLNNKKKKHIKESKDKVAAAVILKNFLDETGFQS